MRILKHKALRILWQIWRKLESFKLDTKFFTISI